MSDRPSATLIPLAQRIEGLSALDAPGKKIAKSVRQKVPAGPVKDALSGTWLGHALHPVLTDVVIGSWTSATMLDLVGGRDGRRGAERLIAIGIAAYAPTAVTGMTDWADAEPADEGTRRVGLVHAASNSVALTLYSASLVARRRGDHRRGALLGLAGAGVLTAGGFLGGHLAYAQGIGVDQTTFDPGPTDWTEALPAAELGAGQTTTAVVADTPVLLHRAGAELLAIHDRCSHRGCSLATGEIQGRVVQCPCHGSRFSLEDGSILQGPATTPQPAFETRERDGTIEVRRRG
jgi:nitrite reductase/ring-hydroxylating ferredoxin subunit/uncharacterized membrane protein